MKKLLLVLIVLNFFSCAKKEILLTSPVINTTEVSFSNDSTVTTGGNISSDGNSPITSRGIVWDLSPNPTIILNTKTNLRLVLYKLRIYLFFCPKDGNAYI